MNYHVGEIYNLFFFSRGYGGEGVLVVGQGKKNDDGAWRVTHVLSHVPEGGGGKLCFSTLFV